jgi:hypothetical protein
MTAPRIADRLVTPQAAALRVARWDKLCKRTFLASCTLAAIRAQSEPLIGYRPIFEVPTLE